MSYQYTGDGALRVREKETSITSSYKELKREVFRYGYNGLLKTYGSSSWQGSSIACIRDTTSPPQWQWEYRYSAGGERESKRHTVAPLDGKLPLSHLWTYYLLGGNKQQLAVYNGRETSELDACSNTSHRVHFYPTEYLTYGNGGSALITTRPTGKREYKIVDHLGSTRVVIDSNGVILSTYDYEPFGKPLAKTGLDSRKSFIDKEKDAESESNNFGVRQYDPLTGRFLGIDPLWENEEQRGLSPYHYCKNNPLIYKDPDGKFWHIIGGAAIGGLIGGGFELGKQLMNGEKVNWSEVGGATLKGAIIGGVAAATGGAAGLGTQMIVGGIAGGVGVVADKVVQGKKVTSGDVGIGMASGAVGGAVANGVGKLIEKATNKMVIVATTVSGQKSAEGVKKIANEVEKKVSGYARSGAATGTDKALQPLKGILKNKREEK